MIAARVAGVPRPFSLSASFSASSVTSLPAVSIAPSRLASVYDLNMPCRTCQSSQGPPQARPAKTAFTRRPACLGVCQALTETRFNSEAGTGAQQWAASACRKPSKGELYPARQG